MIGITGATGSLSRLVLNDLLSAPSSPAAPPLPRIRLLARNPDKALALIPPSASASAAIDAKPISYLAADAALSTASLTGVSTLFFVSAGESPTRVDEHRALVDAAVSARVKHIVYTSFYNNSPEAVFVHGRDHYHTEQYIMAKGKEDAGVKWTFLRDNFYQDILPYFVTDGALRGPAGQGKLSAVAKRDVGAVAALVLRNPEQHAGKIYDLTGPEDLSCQEIVGLLGAEFSYLDETMDEAWASRRGSGAEDWLIEAWISTYTAIKVGEVGGVSGDIEKLLGRRATTLAETIQEMKDKGEWPLGH